MKKKYLTGLICLFLLSFYGNHLFAEEEQPAATKKSSYQLSAGISTGILHGTVFELVYLTRRDIGSELQWEMKPLFYLGSFVEFSKKRPLESMGFYAKLGLKLGIPAESGVMEDRDWLAAENTLSHFSRSDNLTDSAILIDALFGWSVPFFSAFVVTPLLGFHYMHYEWTAENGYAQYGRKFGSIQEAWDASIPKIPIDGPVITYEQNWMIGSLGLSLRYDLLKRFVIEGSFLFSPLILVYSIDNHLLRNADGIQFNDTISGGYLLEPSLAFSYSFNEKMTLTASASYRYTNNSRGYSLARDNASGFDIAKSRSGTKYQVWDAGIRFRYSF